MSKVISKISPRIFQIYDKRMPESALTLNFNPIVELNRIHPQNKTNKNTYVHWQAKPFGLRQFGVYDEVLDKYFSCAEFVFSRDKGKNSHSVQVDETIIKTIPVAAICYPWTTVKGIVDNRLLIVDAI
ncbi:MAG: hypothetical protein ACRDBG_07850 [Waterburya sp.]